MNHEYVDSILILGLVPDPLPNKNRRGAFLYIFGKGSGRAWLKARSGSLSMAWNLMTIRPR